MLSTMLSTLRQEALTTRTMVLVALVVQTTAAVLLMRYSRTAIRPPGSGPPYKARSGSCIVPGLGFTLMG